MEDTIQFLLKILFENIKDEEIEPCSLNFCVSDGKVVIATRYIFIRDD